MRSWKRLCVVHVSSLKPLIQTLDMNGSVLFCPFRPILLYWAWSSFVLLCYYLTLLLDKSLRFLNPLTPLFFSVLFHRFLVWRLSLLWAWQRSLYFCLFFFLCRLCDCFHCWRAIDLMQQSSLCITCFHSSFSIVMFFASFLTSRSLFFCCRLVGGCLYLGITGHSCTLKDKIS
jgi:hypothetical protein